MLTPQLSSPRASANGHRLPCYVQVYEITAAQRLESLAAAVFGDASCASQFQLLTGEVAAKLQIAAMLPPQPRIRHQIRREPSVLLPYDRVLRLQLANDPTVEEAIRDRGQPQRNSEPSSSPASTTAASPGAASILPTLKNAIPERLVKPWEFQLSREEALYDMNLVGSFGGSLRFFFRRLKVWLTNRGEFRKWQTLLSGKSPDEQLWAVRPPKGALSDSTIREWAQETLKLAGYDPRTMLLEWEIFWRRKGC